MFVSCFALFLSQKIKEQARQRNRNFMILPKLGTLLPQTARPTRSHDADIPAGAGFSASILHLEERLSLIPHCQPSGPLG